VASSRVVGGFAPRSRPSRRGMALRPSSASVISSSTKGVVECEAIVHVACQWVHSGPNATASGEQLVVGSWQLAVGSLVRRDGGDGLSESGLGASLG
jgi:hypothetical protein